MIRCIDCKHYSVDDKRDNRHLCSAGSALVALHENEVASFHTCSDGDPTPSMAEQYSQAYEAFVRAFQMGMLKHTRIDSTEVKNLYCDNKLKRLIEVAEESKT